MSATLTRPEPKRRVRPGPGRAAVRNAAEDAGRRAFLRLVSHEMRTPLNAIIGFSEIISTELYGPINDPRYREHAEMVHAAGQKLSKLVNDVIELARLEAGVMDLHIGPEEPAQVLADVRHALAAEAEVKGAHLVIAGATDTLVSIDSRAVKAVLGQLISNAVAASPPGGVVELSSAATPSGVVFQVSDQGPGVPQRDIQRLLRPFEQGENALTRRGEGAGLGLPIARLYAEAMGGRLRLQNRPTGGLSACVFLPAADG